MKKIIVLGGGLVGRVMAIDLAKSHKVTVADINDEALNFVASQGIEAIKMDLTNPENIKYIVPNYDLVIGAVPGFMGFQTVKAVIESGLNYAGKTVPMVDISFFPEDALDLYELAKENGVTVVTDCGVAPGMGNIILGYHANKMEVESYECLVGGLPVVREWPFEYKAVFSPIDVIEEYTRPARYKLNGDIVVREALSEPELVNFEGVGTLESWNSDGLRSLLTTMPDIPNMVEKTLRYPGCIEYLRVLREIGFFSYDPVEINGVQVRPIDLTSKLVFPKWKLKPGEEEFTVMRIKISGNKNGENKTYEYNLLDRTDKETNTLSMARTTGYTCTAVAELVLRGMFNQKGVFPPEYIGDEEENFDFIIQYLIDRNVHYKVKVS